MGLKAIQTEKYTIRLARGDHDHEVSRVDIIAVQAAVNHGMGSLKLDGHLFVTIIPGTSIQDGPEPEDHVFGLYHQGLQHIAVAGICPEDWPTGEDWIDSLKITVLHEMVHYWQELNGKLDGTEENETEAEKLAMELLESMPKWAK